jgi:hypothetical protein
MRRSIAILFFGFSPLFAVDCQCPTATTQDQFDLATSVFLGKVVEIHQDKKAPTEYVFDVQDVFKGNVDEGDVILRDAEADTPCATTYEGGKSYLVYSRWIWGKELTSRCMGTKPIELAENDRAVIGPGNAWKSKVYPKLREICMGRFDTPCCLSSIKAMEAGSYLPEPPEGGCPAGYKPNVKPCKGSLRWCEPI